MAVKQVISTNNWSKRWSESFKLVKHELALKYKMMLRGTHKKEDSNYNMSPTW